MDDLDLSTSDILKSWKDRFKELPAHIDRAREWPDVVSAVSRVCNTHPSLTISGTVRSLDGNLDNIKTSTASTIKVIDEILEAIVSRHGYGTLPLPTIDLTIEPRLNMPTTIESQHHMQINLGLILTLGALPAVSQLLKSTREQHHLDVAELAARVLPPAAVADVVNLIGVWVAAEKERWSSCILPATEPTEGDLFLYVQRFIVAREFGRLLYINNPGFGISVHELTRNHILKWLDVGSTKEAQMLSGLSEKVVKHYREALRSENLLECWIEEITMDAFGYATCLEIFHAMEYPRLRMLLYSAIALVFSMQLIFEAYQSARGHDPKQDRFPWALARTALFLHIQANIFKLKPTEFFQREWGSGLAVRLILDRLGSAAWEKARCG